MKKLLSVLLVAVLLVTAMPLGAFEFKASAATSGYYTYRVSNGEATITDCSTSISGNVTIPSTLGGYPVTSIGDDAFYNCSKLTSITIPDSVTSIGYYAFEYCSKLTSINVSSGNSNYSSQDGVLFNKDKTILICYPAGKTNTSYIIPNSVTSIGEYAFSDCIILTSITIPDSVTSIGEGAFYNCTSLTSITIPNSVTSIGSSAFSSCDSLTSITIPNSVTSIGSSAFSECNSLTSVTIPYSVTSIGDYAFFYCDSLTCITIPNSVTSIGDYAFSDCTSLTSITIPNSVTSIGEGAFRYCSGLTSITIPDSVTSIGSSAFYYCDSLTCINIALGNSNYSSDNGALFNKNKTTLIFYPAGKTNTSYTIPDSVTSIGKSAFYNCSKITSITIGNSVTSIGNYAFYNCSKLTSITIGDSVTSIGDSAFEYCRKLTNITIPYGVTTIGDSTFSDCSSLTSITIPDSVTSIGDSAFSYCSSLTSITIPNSVTSIESSAFSGCDSLTSITIPNSVTSIGNSAFYNCSKLTSITIGDSVTSIGYYAFYYCDSLTCINIALGNSNYSSDNGALFNKNKTTLIFYPAGKTNTSYTIPDSVTSIGKSAFYNCSKITSITIGNSVTSIGNYAFYNCSKLTSITIGDSVTSIGDSAFSSCFRLINIYYRGSQDNKSFISIGSNNSSLTNATWYYNVCTSIDTHIYDNQCDTNCNICNEIRTVSCEQCTGTGQETNYTECSDCAGKGSTSLSCTKCGGDGISGYKDTEIRCARCLGSGMGTKEKTCSSCSGNKGDAYCKTCGMWLGTYDVHSLVCLFCPATAIVYNACKTCKGKGTVTVREGSCTNCGGVGTFPSKQKIDCTYCEGGKNYIDCEQCVDGKISSKSQCTKCTGCGERFVAPNAPILKSADLQTVILEEIPNGEYSKDGINWQKSPVFKNLQLGQEYNFYQRFAKTTTTFSSIASEPLKVLPHEHTYDNACDTTCNICSTVRTVGDHIYDNTCDTDCNICGDVRNVTHTRKIFITPATTSQDGYAVKKCTLCGDISSQRTIKKIKSFTLSTSTYLYNGKVRTPGVTIKDSAGNTISSKYYTVTYAKGRKNVGEYKVTVKFKGDYSGSKNLYFTIVPPKTTVSSVASGKKSFTVKVSKKSTQVTGYQIQYATNKNFTGASRKTVSSYSSVKHTFKNLKAKTTYYVRVRTFKKVGNKVYYSPYSTYKIVKTK